MEVIKIVELHLKAHGFDGLYSDECGCFIDDLAPCCEIQGSCRAGYKHTSSVSGQSVISCNKTMSDEAIQAVLDAI